MFDAIIYKITCNITNECYIGSTTLELKTRINQHKYKSNRTSSKQIIDRNNYVVEVIESKIFYCKRSLLLLEGKYINITPNCINKITKLGQTKEQRSAIKKYKNVIKKANKKNKKSFRQQQLHYKLMNELLIKFKPPRHYQKSRVF